MMNGNGKSDEPIVPRKAANKADMHNAHAAEPPEGRGSVKGKPCGHTSTRAQDRIRLQHALKRIRKAIVRDRSIQLTGLWHHVYDPGRFRPGRSEHRALDALYMGLMRKRVNWIVDADIRGFFDTIDRQWTMKFIAHRIGDKRVLRHIAKWLKAGVMEEEKLTRSEEGTPQGGSISPLLSNIYLHYVLDLRVEQWRKRTARGEVIIVRYADDFVMGFQHKEDAERFLKELRERLAKFNLKLHPKKTRLIEFGRNAARQRRARGEGKPETFNFLGFTHFCDKTRKRGRFIVLRQTMRKRMQAKLLEIKEEHRMRMNESVPATGRWLRAVAGGYYRYHAVPRNLPAMMSFYRQIGRQWAASLSRRSHKAKLDWRRMHTIIKRWIPSPHITHPYPEHRFGVTT